MDSKSLIGNQPRKKLSCILYLILFFLIFAGCSQEAATEEPKAAGDSVEQNKAAIEAVLEKEFTGPDEKVIQLKEEMDEKLSKKMEETPEESVITSSEEDPEQQNYLSYLENTYASYFTDKAFSDFTKIYAFSHHQPGGNYKMKIADMEIVQSESASTNYHFTVYVDYENPSGETAQYEIVGSSIAAEEGKVGKIEFDDKDGLFQRINEDTHE